MARSNAGWSVAVAIGLANVFGIGACGSSTTGTSSGDSGAHADGGTEASSGSGCKTDEDCKAKLPPTTPAGCATASCDALAGTCVFASKDEDGDGHTAFACASTNGVKVTAGDDCNDHDANLYPGHPESCGVAADGGVAPAGLCTGQLTCLASGAESACTPTLTCTNQACVDSACVGVCAPSATRCSGDNSLQTCQTDGTWGAGVPCGPSSPTCVSTASGSECAGVCASGALQCSGQQPQTCNSMGQWVSTGDAGPCGAGEVCQMGACQSGCDIGGTVYASGAANPAEPCQSCQPTVDGGTAGWTNVANGTSCGSGEVCGGGQCGSQCDIAGAAVPSGGVNPANPCQACQPASTTAGWSNLADGTSCAVGGDVCQGGNCVTGCLVGGALEPVGVNAANACQACEPAMSTSAWTTLAPGTSCGMGMVCGATGCEAGCSISGMVYAAGTANPASGCQRCEPSMSTTAWTMCPSGGTCIGNATCNITFAETGSPASFVVPVGATKVTVNAAGGQGANCSSGGLNAAGGVGGLVTATIPVTPGEMLTVTVGGAGGGTGLCNFTGGYNGGGTGPTGSDGGGGGGASDVRQGGTGPGSRVLVAGGGGGGGVSVGAAFGGAGGAAGTVGGKGGGTAGGGGGQPGTGSAGGGGGVGAPASEDGVAGTVVGGAGGLAMGGGGSGGSGGGGYYGGGGGGGGSSAGTNAGGGGGGGSSYVGATATGVAMPTPNHMGAGQIIIAY